MWSPAATTTHSPGLEPLSRLRSGRAAHTWCPGRAGRGRSKAAVRGRGQPQAEVPGPRRPWASCSHAEPSPRHWLRLKAAEIPNVLKPDTGTQGEDTTRSRHCSRTLLIRAFSLSQVKEVWGSAFLRFRSYSLERLVLTTPHSLGKLSSFCK